jgi:hypothetical protein
LRARTALQTPHACLCFTPPTQPAAFSTLAFARPDPVICCLRVLSVHSPRQPYTSISTSGPVIPRLASPTATHPRRSRARVSWAFPPTHAARYPRHLFLHHPLHWHSPARVLVYHPFAWTCLRFHPTHSDVTSRPRPKHPPLIPPPLDHINPSLAALNRFSSGPPSPPVTIPTTSPALSTHYLPSTTAIALPVSSASPTSSPVVHHRNLPN